MSRLRTISDKLDYIAMGKLNVEQMEYICEINQEVNLKDREIEKLNNDYLEMEDNFRVANDEIEKLQDRIDKAIELIEADYFEDGSGENIEKVLEILKGE